MTARSMMLVVAAMAISVLAIGCGGGGDDSSEGESSAASATSVTTSSLSKAAFVKQASGICEQARNSIINSGANLSKAIKAEMVPAFEAMTEEIASLGAPSGDEAEIEAFLSALQTDTAALEADSPSISELTEIEEEFKDSAAIAHQYGLPKCAFYTRFTAS